MKYIAKLVKEGKHWLADFPTARVAKRLVKPKPKPSKWRRKHYLLGSSPISNTVPPGTEAIGAVANFPSCAMRSSTRSTSAITRTRDLHVVSRTNPQLPQTRSAQSLQFENRSRLPRANSLDCGPGTSHRILARITRASAAKRIDCPLRDLVESVRRLGAATLFVRLTHERSLDVIAVSERKRANLLEQVLRTPGSCHA